MQPKKTRLEGAARTCPACGHNALEPVRHDLYLSLFFIPLFPVKRGQALWQCSRCGWAGDPEARPPAWPRPAEPRPQPPASQPEGAAPSQCRFCGGPLQPGFKYCPACGARI